MIVTFQSPASGDVIMFGDVAQRMMKIMGKEASTKGIITVEQLPDAIARLRAAIAGDKPKHAESVSKQLLPVDSAEDASERVPVSLTQRAVPLLELLEVSLKKNKPVVWGV